MDDIDNRNVVGEVACHIRRGFNGAAQADFSATIPVGGALELTGRPVFGFVDAGFEIVNSIVGSVTGAINPALKNPLQPQNRLSLT